jgi:hypothetical protein
MTLDYEKVNFTKISDIEIPDIFFNRLKTNVEQLDSYFGMGILPGSTITLKALPGVGKSIFSLTLAELLTNEGYNVAYTSGEEDIRQLAYNCKRLNVQNLQVGTLTDVDSLLEQLPNLDFMVIDSFQTLTTEKDLNSREKIKYAIDNLVKQAKINECALIFIVQETSSGEIRGGTMLPYAVDVNMEILKTEDDPELRIINVYKNRFGPTLRYESRLRSSGYEFLGEYIETEKMKKEKENKVSVKDVRKEEIMEMNDPPLITTTRVMEAFDVKEPTAKLLLVELENEMKLIKYGRGPSAVWKVNQ